MHGIPASIIWFGPVWWGTVIKIYSPCNIDSKHAAIIHNVVNLDFIWMLWVLGASFDGGLLDYQTIFSLKYWLNIEENMINFYNVTSLYYKQHCPNLTRQQSIGKGRDSKIQQGVRNRHNLATFPCGSVHVQYLRGSKISFICPVCFEIRLKLRSGHSCPSFSVIQQILFTGRFTTITVGKHISWFSMC